MTHRSLLEFARFDGILVRTVVRDHTNEIVDENELSAFTSNAELHFEVAQDVSEVDVKQLQSRG